MACFEDAKLAGQETLRTREVFDESPKRDGSKIEVESGDGDWVGIERTELEILFGSAMAFVDGAMTKCHRDSILSSDLKTKLYGLHKIATHGTCSDPQPMPFKVSARAKWNAWQKLGEMSPETAMEQYVSLLSESIPRWMEDALKEDDDHDDVLVDSGDVRKLEEIKTGHSKH